jgi:hypothetical protein
MVLDFPVVSSAISLLQWDTDQRVLHVTFTDGTNYGLVGYPIEDLQRWLASGSIGGYWNANVKGRY